MAGQPENGHQMRQQKCASRHTTQTTEQQKLHSICVHTLATQIIVCIGFGLTSSSSR